MENLVTMILQIESDARCTYYTLSASDFQFKLARIKFHAIYHTHTHLLCVYALSSCRPKCPSSGIVDTWYMYSTHSLSSVLICFVVCELIPIYENIVRNFAVSSYQLNTLLYVCCVVLCRSI